MVRPVLFFTVNGLFLVEVFGKPILPRNKPSTYQTCHRYSDLTKPLNKP